MRAPVGSCTHTSAMPVGSRAPVGPRTSRVSSTRTVIRSVWSAGTSTTTEPSSSGVSVARSTRVRWTPVSTVMTSGAAGAAERGAQRRSEPTSWRPGRLRASDGAGTSGACQLVERSPSTAADGLPAGSSTSDSPVARTCRARVAGSPRRTSSRAGPGRGRTSSRGITVVAAGTSSRRAKRPGSSGSIARPGAHLAAPVDSSAPASPSTGLPAWTQSERPDSSWRSSQPDGARESSGRPGRAMVRSSGMSRPPAAKPISETSR